jgi:hypothetical protein
VAVSSSNLVNGETPIRPDGFRVNLQFVSAIELPHLSTSDLH